LLDGGDIYFYFRVRPPAFWLAAAIVGVVAALAAIASAYLFVRWVYAVPLLLLEDLRPREAMAQSGRMSHAAGRWRILGRMATRAAGVMALVGLLALGHGLLDWVFVTVAGDNVGRMIAATALSLSVGLTLGVVVGFASVLAFAVLFACLYTELRPGIGPPAEVDVGARRSSRDRRFGVGSALIVGAVGLVGLAVAITISLIGELDLERTVLTTAHRGASKAAPENTIAALRQAVADGADYAEIDVQRTADGVVVLLHDTDLRRVAGVNSGIWELSLDEVQRLDVGSWFSAEFAGERAPTLTEAIAATKGKMRLNIELKVNGRDDGLAAEVARVLKETGCGEACVVSSLDIATMREIAQYNPNLRRGLIVTAAVGDVSRFDVDFLAINAGSATRDLIDRVHRAGMEAHVWSLSDPVRMQTMIHLGADNILTSRPDVLVRLLQARAKMSDAEKALLMLADLTPGRLWSLGRSQDDGEP
jgi:glycerophosphoryl diester phosphodiesterase